MRILYLHYDAELKPFTGKDSVIKTFLENQPMAVEMLADIQHYVEKWLPSFIADNRSYLNVAIGCTGGQHRSVYFVEQLSAYFAGTNLKLKKQKVITRHRELD
jgi:RNase adapter protein RapZ